MVADHVMMRLTTLDAPFLMPLETRINLPAPPSFNRTHRIDWKARSRKGKHTRWVQQADARILLDGGLRRLTRMPGAFEAILTLDEHTCNLDLDNGVKIVLDYARRLNLIVDDDKKHMKKLTVEWGHAAYGCRLTLRSIP